VSVYVDMAATADAVRAAVAELPKPRGVFEVTVDCNSVTDTFGCRIAVDLTGSFDEQTEGLAIARGYAEQLSLALGGAGAPLLRPAAARPPGQLRSDGRVSEGICDGYRR
jgi:hypothetical protein